MCLQLRNSLKMRYYSPSGITTASMKFSNEVKEFSLTFNSDNTWSIKIEFISIYEFFDRDPPLAEGVMPDGTVTLVCVWSGDYIFKDEVLKLTLSNSDVQVTADPERLLAVVSNDRTKKEYETDFTEGFVSYLMKPFAETTASLKDGELVLIATNAEGTTQKMALD